VARNRLHSTPKANGNNNTVTNTPQKPVEPRTEQISRDDHVRRDHDRFDRDDRLHRYFDIPLLPPLVHVDGGNGGGVIADDAKTQEKAKPKACTWRLADISVESYDTESWDFLRGKTGGKKTSKAKEILNDLAEKAKKFVK